MSHVLCFLSGIISTIGAFVVVKNCVRARAVMMNSSNPPCEITCESGHGEEMHLSAAGWTLTKSGLGYETWEFRDKKTPAGD